MQLEIRVEFPNGELDTETDIDEFKRNVVGQITEIADFSSLTVSESTSPAPEGALGVDQLFQFCIENFENIAQMSKSTAIIVHAVNSLTQMFLKRKRGASDESSKVFIKAGEELIELPGNSKEIDAFVAKIRNKYEKPDDQAGED